MEHIICSINMLILSCLWFFHNIFRRFNEDLLGIVTMLKTVWLNNKYGFLRNNKKQLMRFSNISSMKKQNKIVCTTYIYEVETPSKTKLISTTSTKASPEECFPIKLLPHIQNDELTREDYTKLWLQAYYSIQDE
ncbi:hypothetical protein WA026_017384 [Henosepilachna vigintioctopunctata]|uniref:Uncharacterized protein n=1 Tax=Henosepilachna vigintioctopunctata TaxID=420089 RepID=A0AAW1VDP4_9CUCU